MTTKSPITTHILDVARGKPAVGVAVRLEGLETSNQWRLIGEGTTNADGRVTDLMQPGSLLAGQYRLIFATADYFAGQQIAAFYPQVTIEFSVAAPAEHYHVPLLLSPFGYSTYRGS
ncbi:hydroxyisourate hydrolase [Anatilimnocola floriformis]|uniref:hydroxyisourate hydrolase n=1 Tax=Anatilimnocola floriformis TaxID=2948575 RepID=UPI0020C518E5|nr:hydroxyisourate hydrolase [Anatilimnocola floriformis]